MSGYVRIHRTLGGHHAFRNDAEAMAFAWMVMRAAWRPTRVRYKDRGLVLQRGQLAVSQRDMASALDRDKAWIERLWKRLKAEAMIEVATEAGVAVITICNYATYQASEGEREAPPETPREAVNEAGARQAQGTEQVREEEKKEEGSASIEADGAAVDPVKQIFDMGVELLTAHGHGERQARSLVGKWNQAKGVAEVAAGLIECRTKGIVNPVEWLTKRFQGARYVSDSGWEYRGSDEQIMRDAERRADWTTYYAVKNGAAEPSARPPPRTNGRRGGARSIGELARAAAQ